MVKPIEAAGGVVFRIENDCLKVLLIFRNGVWDIPKGKLEKGESIPMCASREVSEETGSLLPIIVGDLGTTYHEYIQKKTEYGKTTFWYAMVLPQITELIPQEEEGIKSIEWVSLTDAIHQVGFDNLKTILQRFQNWIA
jgi:8-oxo-dGTP pyrophosphatase MutT (NUDIX family)